MWLVHCKHQWRESVASNQKWTPTSHGISLWLHKTCTLWHNPRPPHTGAEELKTREAVTSHRFSGVSVVRSDKIRHLQYLSGSWSVGFLLVFYDRFFLIAVTEKTCWNTDMQRPFPFESKLSSQPVISLVLCIMNGLVLPSRDSNKTLEWWRDEAALSDLHIYTSFWVWICKHC